MGKGLLLGSLFWSHLTSILQTEPRRTGGLHASCVMNMLYEDNFFNSDYCTEFNEKRGVG